MHIYVCPGRSWPGGCAHVALAGMLGCMAACILQQPGRGGAADIIHSTFRREQLHATIFATMANSGYSRANIAERFSEFILNDVQLSSHILGAGSFGEVVLANWGGTICAAKRLHRVFSILPQDAYGSVIKRYLQECHTWSQLRHPGIVLFIGVVFEPGDSYLPLLVMEKMDSSLLHFVESRTKASLPLRHKAKILLQVACAMAYLHGKKLIHRDLTPNNILMDELSIKAKITDFGLTRVTAESRMATKSAAGTPTFMPPEALRLEPRHDSKLDVFSFGNLILFTTTHKWPMPDVQVIR